MNLAELFSLVIGYAIVFGSVSLKLPQIIKIVRNGSANGISLKGHFIETLGYTVSMTWGFVKALPFKDFGENVFVMLQVVPLGLLIGIYQGKVASAVMGTALILGLAAVLYYQLVAIEVHETLLKAQIAFSISSRLPQIYENYRLRSTGDLAFLTYFLAFGGSGARLLTTTIGVPWEKGKATMMAQFSMMTALNGIIVLQFWLYRGAATSPKLANKSTGAATEKAKQSPSPVARPASGTRASSRKDD